MIGIVLAVVSWVVALAITALVRRYALATSMLDVPNARSSHDVPVPRGGGVGFVVPAIVCIAALSFGDMPLQFPLGGVAAILLVAALGWADDNRPLSVEVRLAGHLLAGALVALVARSVGVAPFDSLVPEAVAWLWWVFWTVSAINVANFIDGIDGIMGVQAVVFAVFACVAVGPGQTPAALLALTLVGAATGFLVLNWAPAKIFMGDVGSASLGLIFVIMGILTMRELGWTVVHAFLPLMIIFSDEVLTMGRRLQRGERLSVPHRSHVYQLLVQAGVSHRRVALLYGALALVPAIWAIIHPRGTPMFWIGTIFMLATAFLALLALRRWAEQQAPVLSRPEDRRAPAS